jgi:hypothetical protein
LPCQSAAIRLVAVMITPSRLLFSIQFLIAQFRVRGCWSK